MLHVPSRAMVPGPLDSHPYGTPWIDWGDRGIRPHRQLGPGVHHVGESEAAIGAVGPHDVGGVTIIDHVQGLDAGSHSQLCEPGDVGIGEDLGVLHRSRDTGRLEGVEDLPDGAITDGMGRTLQVGSFRPSHELDEVLRRDRVDSGPLRPTT